MRPTTVRQGGFTLIEMIIVIVILGLIGGLVLTKQPVRSTGFNTDATLRALTNALQLARSRAIAQDREVMVLTAARGFSVDGGAVWVLPPDEALSESRVVFLPDGGAAGGSIVLGAGQRKIAMEVNWLTGRVQAREIVR